MSYSSRLELLSATLGYMDGEDCPASLNCLEGFTTSALDAFHFVEIYTDPTNVTVLSNETFTINSVKQVKYTLGNGTVLLQPDAPTDPAHSYYAVNCAGRIESLLTNRAIHVR